MSILKLPKDTPNVPGVYTFRKRNNAIYVGKAENLKKRLASYFRKNAGPKVEALRSEATKLEWKELTSDVEALIKEAELIKKYHPKYNVIMRDDKNYFFVEFTHEEFPRIFVTHQPLRITESRYKNSHIGPFTSGSALYITLRILRRIFPYCTCKELHKRPCLNAEIGRCLGCCCTRPVRNSPPQRSSGRASAGAISNGVKGGGENESCKKRYQENIKNISAILSGKKKTLLKDLSKKMKEAVKNEEFERAATLRNQIEGIENIFLHQKFLDQDLLKRRRGHEWQKIERTLQAILGTSRRLPRVEGYDISNISGTEATGSMVVFVNGAPSKNDYRKFKIKSVHQISDVDMHREVMKRRFNHPEWGMPDILLIDGGKPQLNAILQTLQIKNIKGIFVAGLAKREEELFLPGRRDSIRLDSLPPHTMHFFQHVRDESHRFAKKYHHKLREISFRK